VGDDLRRLGSEVEGEAGVLRSGGAAEAAARSRLHHPRHDTRDALAVPAGAAESGVGGTVHWGCGLGLRKRKGRGRVCQSEPFAACSNNRAAGKGRPFLALAGPEELSTPGETDAGVGSPDARSTHSMAPPSMAASTRCSPAPPGSLARAASCRAGGFWGVKEVWVYGWGWRCRRVGVGWLLMGRRCGCELG
jgi:hypothetical protein